MSRISPRLSTALWALVLLAGCGTQPHGRPAQTLGENRNIPVTRLRNLYSPEEWQALLHRPYASYVILSGLVQRDGSIAISRVNESFPDSSRDSLAAQLCAPIRVVPLQAGSRAPTGADVYVIFYEGVFRQALIFAHRREPVSPVRMPDRVSVLTRDY